MILQDLRDNREEILSLIPEYTERFSVKADVKTIMQVMAMDVEFAKETEIEDFVCNTIYNMRYLKTTIHQALYSEK